MEGAQIVATHGAIVNYGSTRSNGDGREGKKTHEGSDESGKNIVFDNQTENVHSLSQNKANKMPTATTTTQCGVAKGAEKAGKNTNTHARVYECIVGLLNSRICVQFLAICHPPPHASLPPYSSLSRPGP